MTKKDKENTTFKKLWKKFTKPYEGKSLEEQQKEFYWIWATIGSGILGFIIGVALFGCILIIGATYSMATYEDTPMADDTYDNTYSITEGCIYLGCYCKVDEAHGGIDSEIDSEYTRSTLLCSWTDAKIWAENQGYNFNTECDCS